MVMKLPAVPTAPTISTVSTKDEVTKQEVIQQVFIEDQLQGPVDIDELFASLESIDDVDGVQVRVCVLKDNYLNYIIEKSPIIEVNH